jgi:hypothetical protein
LLTRDRVGAALAVVAAIVGLVLVFATHNPKADDDDKAATSPATSQVQAPAPNQTQLPGVTPTQQAPQPPENDDDD